MFEAAILPATAATGEDLRPLDWRELVVRFAATRDLRALVMRTAGHGGSFAAHADTGLFLDCDENRGSGQLPVNLAALGAMKPLEAKTATTEVMAEGDQGTR